MAEKEVNYDNITQLKVQDAFSGVNYLETLAANEGKTASLDKINLLSPADQGFVQHSVSSLTNKFTVFQYAPLNAGASYRIEGHFIGYTNTLKTDNEYATDSNLQAIGKLTEYQAALDAARKNTTVNSDQLAKTISERIKYYETAIGELKNSAKNFRSNSKDILSNPTAKRLIDWGAQTSAGTPLGFQPYSHSDFMYCKYYGKIPNNRLITLRRYPFPIGDSLRIGGPKKNAIPVAQAVTWFGGETSNTLNSLGVFNWDMPWQEIDAVDGVTGQTIEGNEITLDSLISIVEGAAGNAGKSIASAIKAAYVGVYGESAQMAQISKFEAKLQEYQRKLYDRTEGPYWNRIYGPVNVITKSSMRQRGIQTTNWQNGFSINFHYSFRSFSGLSPKIAALDIISNFMNLTYQDAQFLGQLARYFPKLGVKFDPTTTEAIGNILSNWGSTTTGNSSKEFATLYTNLISAVKLAGSKILSDPGGVGQQTIQAALMGTVLGGDAIPRLISVKSALSDRPVGEWHLTVGNPMNPIFVMGDLLCTDVKMKWDDEMGPDDFPTGVMFTVTLRQGKPRDKVAIERMLNHGQTSLTAGALRTSASDDTFGEANSETWKAITSKDSSGDLATTYASIKDGTGGANYRKFRDRFLSGYGLAKPEGTEFTNSSSKLDDSLLFLYYQRQYGNN